MFLFLNAKNSKYCAYLLEPEKIIVHALAEESKSLKQSGKKCDEMAPKGTCAMSVTLSEPL